MDSILKHIKKLLGPGELHNHFDTEIMTHINTAFMELEQMGVGPESGFSIEDESATWSEYIPKTDKNFEAVKTYIYLYVKLIFDPPLNASVMNALQQKMERLEWRLNFEAESTSKTTNTPEIVIPNTTAVIGQCVLGSIVL